MIIGIVENDVQIKCKCDFTQIINIEGKTSLFNEEFGEYENIVVQCPSCNTFELLNMNIPLNDIDDGVETGELSVEEEVNRHYIRILQRIVREDLKG